MAYDYFWSQVKKNSDSKNSHKTLADAYSLVKEDNVALYSRDIGQNTQLPPAPEGTSAFAVVPKEDLNKIKTLSKVRTAGPALKQLFNQGGIEDTYFNIVKKSISGCAEDSGYDHVMDLLLLASEKKNETGGFIPLELGEYNIIDKLTQAIKSENSALVDSGLSSFLLGVLGETPKYAPTNIGPGEFFCCLFTDAKAAAGAGDLEANNGSRKIELKASGARLGGGSARNANHAAQNIIKYLSSKKFSYQQTEFLEEEKNNLIDALSDVIEQNVNNKKYSIQSLMDSVRSIISSSRYHRQVIAKVYVKNIFGRLEEIVKDIQTPEQNSEKYFKKNTQPPNLLSPVSASGKIQPADGRRTTTLTLAQYLQSQLRSLRESFFSRKSAGKDDLKEDLENNVESERNLAYLLKNTFNSIKNNPLKKTIQVKDLINIVLFTNSYGVEELQEYGYDVVSELTSILNPKGVDGILNLTTGALVDLIGGLHLISYAKESQFTEFMLMNKESGKVINVATPENLQDAINFCLRPEVKVGPEVDNPEGTIRASTASYFIA